MSAPGCFSGRDVGTGAGLSAGRLVHAGMLVNSLLKELPAAPSAEIQSLSEATRSQILKLPTTMRYADFEMDHAKYGTIISNIEMMKALQ
jgi:hypothetical protein